MHKIIPIIFAIFCSNIALSGEFAQKFGRTVSLNEETTRTLSQYPGSARVVKALFGGTLMSMKAWLEAQKTIGNPYTMDDEDNALLEKFTNLAQ